MEKILDYLDPYDEIFDYRLHRESCIVHHGMYLKDLRILGNRDLSQVVLVDNATYSFSM